MKKCLLFLALASQSILSHAQGSSDKNSFLTKSLATESVQSARVETSGGNISITGGSAADARIEMYVTGNNGNDLSKDEIQKRLDDDYDLSIKVENNKLTAIAKAKSNFMNWKKSLSISFKVYVPQNVSSELSTSGGNISLSNLSGTENFSTSGGNLQVDGLDGNIHGRTSGGNISLSNSKSNIDLETSGGNIDAANCSGNIKLETSGGSLKLSSLKGTIHAGTSGGSVNGSDIEGELSAETSGGNIRFTNLSCSLATSTSGGNIQVAIISLGKYVKIDNSGGNVDLELPQGKGLDLKLSANKIKVNPLTNFSGTNDENRMNGTLNGGGIPVTIDASSGQIYLTLK